MKYLLIYISLYFLTFVSSVYANELERILDQANKYTVKISNSTNTPFIEDSYNSSFGSGILIDKNYPNPKVEMGEHCLKPYKCPYVTRCNNLKPFSKKTPISILPRVGKKLEQEYKRRDITSLEDIPSAELNESQKIIQQAHKDNKPC